MFRGLWSDKFLVVIIHTGSMAQVRSIAPKAHAPRKAPCMFRRCVAAPLISVLVLQAISGVQIGDGSEKLA